MSGSDVTYADWKVVLLGGSSVGKSSIVTRLVTGKFMKNSATIGAAFSWKEVFLEDKKAVKLSVWDTAGQERYRALTPMYYRNTDVALIVYDVTNSTSIEGAKSWIEELHNYVNEDRRNKISIWLVGNKIDLLPTAQDSDTTYPHEDVLRGIMHDIPNPNELAYVSAKTGAGIEEMFNEISRQVPEEAFEASNKDSELLQLNTTKNSSHSCNC
ncbi:Rab family GTPase YPT10 KNAG_0C01840 [Huiozyma naganishii CBS 8797]|uniref:Uncharacterized protein n=1 Tax=Huiozyma naganishii (strain ATCC MYA-139 / BCRC 22969 / CBS 8797 / KCTC 17520 / NBRC 10181 / NCYC 3082 / Yp74L-3) TaxID=1071383 RepID=J7RIE1_HUIN7|nr:hypothetical protein KNAG_0C01840 [Kazachstania naganishii CBS 8797]CCK69298.1 hypothetical protein KNAG_0C01840 [Kazachstania naganishii CBS 8797]